MTVGSFGGACLSVGWGSHRQAVTVDCLQLWCNASWPGQSHLTICSPGVEKRLPECLPCYVARGRCASFVEQGVTETGLGAMQPSTLMALVQCMRISFVHHNNLQVKFVRTHSPLCLTRARKPKVCPERAARARYIKLCFQSQKSSCRTCS